MKNRIFVLYVLILTAFALCGCGSHGLSRYNPTPVTVWHCYDGAGALKFNELVADFNSTFGRENGITVTALAMGSAESLEAALFDSIAQKTGSLDPPDIFQCSPDTAAALEGKAELVDFDDYLTEDEKLIYVRRFLDGGCVGEEGSWKLFATAQSTQVLMLNKTDWDKFAAQTGADTDSLLTWEGLARTAADYYEWSGGKAFFGHDDLADYLIVGSSQLGSELFRVSGDSASLGLDKTVMYRLLDSFYLPYISGYYTQSGKYRSDDIRTGEIIAMVCSSARASYFPDKVVTADGVSYPIECMSLPLPNFEGTASYAALSGGGMAMLKSGTAKEYAGVLFLKWLADEEQGLCFSAQSGYMPVTLESVKPDVMSAYLDANPADERISSALLTSLSQNEAYIMYTPAGFDGGTQAHAILRQTLLTFAKKDRDRADTVDYDARFDEWYSDIANKLQECCE